jgi:hypothetical protein
VRPCIADRRDVGLDPVIVAVLAAVLHDAGPRYAGADRRPQVGERFGRHVGWRTMFCGAPISSFLREAADLDEIRVDIDDIAVEIGLRDDSMIVIEFDFAVW